MRVDLVGVIEATYRSELNDVEWLRGIAERVAPGLDNGYGVGAALYELSLDGHAHMGATSVVGGDEAFFESMRLATSTVSPSLIARMFRVGPTCQAMSTLLGMPKKELANVPAAV
jgi:hypothetical protein